ncbi:conjugal transfer protein TraD [Acidisoma cellulosilytica]|uniref:Conjugal transfer protein TraD n=1 Tax=Acidisoma cellulosilyticum TaxID=2802395 RepID=A0A963Z7F5_9PROT|nr:conjugal transfer protein TraD [Acidisoma cellulosilyticum]MCB8883963.1 conjugal transfer protein TraD [Acidisoma cellulosilyticum]
MRKPRDIDAELKTLQERARELKTRKTMQLGELITATGADILPFETLAGVLLAAVDQAKEKPEALVRWTERGQAFFQEGGSVRVNQARAFGRKPGNGSSAATNGTTSPTGDAGPGSSSP